jgi:hypothetical protein
MSLHVVRNGILTVVPVVLQVLFVLGLVADVVGSVVLLVCSRRRRRCLLRFASDAVSFGARNLLAGKGSPALVSAAPTRLAHQDVGPRLDVLATEEYACEHRRVRQCARGFVCVPFVVRKCYSLLLLGGALRPADGLGVRITFTAKRAACAGRPPKC